MQNHEKTLKDAMWMMRKINWKWNDDKIVILQDLSNIKNFWKEKNGPVDEHKKAHLNENIGRIEQRRTDLHNE